VTHGRKRSCRNIRGANCRSLAGRRILLSVDRVHRPGKHVGQGHLRPVQPGQFPQLFQGIRRPADWYEYWDEILDTSDAPCYKWFKGGKINASYNCVDRHLKDNKNKTAIHFVPEPLEEKYEHITYQELYVRVNEFAALLGILPD
jgi:hypothetical protein